MDKTGWIVVSLCAALLGLQWYYNSTQEPAPQAPAAPAAATAPVEPAAAATTPAATPASVATTPAPALPAVEKKVIATLTSKDAEGKPVAKYNFCNIGGAISGVEMLGQVINSTREELKGRSPEG